MRAGPTPENLPLLGISYGTILVNKCTNHAVTKDPMCRLLTRNSLYCVTENVALSRQKIINLDNEIT